MDEHAVDYSQLGKWITEVPTHCARPRAPHQLASHQMLSGWVDCRCGGHRTVRCLAYDGDRRCDAIHYLPPTHPACSCVRRPPSPVLGRQLVHSGPPSR